MSPICMTWCPLSLSSSWLMQIASAQRYASRFGDRICFNASYKFSPTRNSELSRPFMMSRGLVYVVPGSNWLQRYEMAWYSGTSSRLTSTSSQMMSFDSDSSSLLIRRSRMQFELGSRGEYKLVAAMLCWDEAWHVRI